MSKVILSLGDFNFGNFEIPEKITRLGGSQKTVIHDLVGGGRVVDTMGAVHDQALTWSGLFYGEKAVTRAKYIDAMRKLGNPVVLKWSSFRYEVLITRFNYDYRREFELPYTIECTIISDASDPANGPSNYENEADQLIQKELVVSETYVERIKVPKNETENFNIFKELFKALIATVRGVMKLARAIISTIRKIKKMIKDIRAWIKRTIEGFKSAFKSISTLGGVLSGKPKSYNAKKLKESADNAEYMANLSTIDFSLARMDRHLDTVLAGTPSATLAVVTVANTTLFDLAAMYYDDPTKWETIAFANKMIDPYIDTPVTILVPRI